jgi:hypothetical protein
MVISREWEEKFLEKMKVEVGVQATRKISKMFQDMD